MAAASGAAAILQRPAQEFEVVKLIGAAYLIFLGLRTTARGLARTAGVRMVGPGIRTAIGRA